MKTLKKVPIRLVEVEYIPQELEEGVFYLSDDGAGNHLCVCGCGENRPIRIHPEHWIITQKEPLTITPSLQHITGCKSHYIITNGIANIV